MYILSPEKKSEMKSSEDLSWEKMAKSNLSIDF